MKPVRIETIVAVVATMVSLVAAGNAGTKTFTGSNSVNWSDALNWNPAGAPASSDSVIIPDLSSVTFSPITLDNNGNARSLIIQNGGTLKLAANNKILTVSADVIVASGGAIINQGNKATTLSIGGNLIVNGSFALTGFTVAFVGGGSHAISGTSNVQFYNLTVASPNSLTIDGTNVGVTGSLSPTGFTPSLVNGGTFNPGGAPLPITLAWCRAAFNASSGKVLVEWQTLSEINNYGFTIERRAPGSSTYVDAGFVPTKGNGITPHAYSFTDATAPAGPWYYRLRQVDLDGTTVAFDEILVDVPALASVSPAGQPRDFALRQNYPNPFNPQTTIEFTVANAAPTSVKVFDITGRQLMTLFDEVAQPGKSYTVTFNGANLASGTYLYVLESGARREIRKMCLVK